MLNIAIMHFKRSYWLKLSLGFLFVISIFLLTVAEETVQRDAYNSKYAGCVFVDPNKTPLEPYWPADTDKIVYGNSLDFGQMEYAKESCTLLDGYFNECGNDCEEGEPCATVCLITCEKSTPDETETF